MFDLIFDKCFTHFQITCVIDSGMYNFHLMTVTFIRQTFKKIRPSKLINYRSYINFYFEIYTVSLRNTFSNVVLVNNDDGLEKFCKTTVVA